MPKYKQVEEGEWVMPKRKGYHMQCCDCGLIHRVNIKVIKRGGRSYVYWQMFRVTKCKSQPTV